MGTLAGSAALVADGFNSAGDVLATGIGMVGYQVGRTRTPSIETYTPVANKIAPITSPANGCPSSGAPW